MTPRGVAAPVGLNLHTHLEGSVRPRTAAELAQAVGVREPPGGWEQALRMRVPGTLTTFLEHVATAYPLFANPEAIGRIVAEAVEDAAADGAAYLELRFGPATHATPHMDIVEVVAAAAAGLREGGTRTGLLAGLVVCALRHHDADVNERVAIAAADHAGRGVVGFDVAGDEVLFPSLEPMVRPFGIAAAAGLGLTAHAGEAGAGERVREAVERLGVRRIGHGVRAADSPELLRWAADEGVCFEQCVTSNVLTGAAASYATHPIRALLQAGCDVVLGDDDPTTTGTPLSSEVALLTEGVGLDPDEIRRVHATSVARAFCHEPTRSALRELMAPALTGSRASV